MPNLSRRSLKEGNVVAVAHNARSPKIGSWKPKTTGRIRFSGEAYSVPRGKPPPKEQFQ